MPIEKQHDPNIILKSALKTAKADSSNKALQNLIDGKFESMTTEQLRATRGRAASLYAAVRSKMPWYDRDIIDTALSTMRTEIKARREGTSV